MSGFDEESPFHPGELEAQARAGGGAAGHGIGGSLTDQHRRFFEALPFVAVATTNGGWPVATLLAGAPGFISAPDRHTLRIAASVDPSDPAAAAFVQGAPFGLLGIDLGTRRRNRANGVIAAADAGGLLLDVRQAFGNCPQYIHLRDAHPAALSPGATQTFEGLDDAARATIADADTFFVASAARTEEDRGGVDISHRGGPRGFVSVDGRALTIPDYRGNRYFNTLGNLVSEPRCGLLFVDFAAGDLLHLQGTAEVVWDGPEVAAHLGAERLWKVHVERGWRRPGAVSLRWSPRRQTA